MTVGIDLVEVSRFENKPQNFYEKIFTKNEIEYCLQFQNYAEHFAGHFACKEAVMKALGKGIDTLPCLSIEICHTPDKTPFVNLVNESKTIFNSNHPHSQIAVSISHTSSLATAICIIQ